jgi:ribose transport system substrate-binding protein
MVKLCIRLRGQGIRGGRKSPQSEHGFKNITKKEGKVHRKWMWISLTMVMLLGLLVGLIGCSSSETNSPGATATPMPRAVPNPQGAWDTQGYFPISMQGKRIDMTYVLEAHPVSLGWKAGMTDVNNEFNFGINISHFDSALSAETLSNIADGSIARGVDLVMISPIDAVTGSAVFKRVQAAGIPVISIATATEYLADVTIAVDWYEMGRMTAEWLADKLNKSGKVAIVTGDFTTPSAVGRVKGFTEVMDKYPGIEIVATVETPTGPWTRQGAYDSTKGVLSKTPNIDGIFGVDDELAMGVALAVNEAGKKGQIMVVSTQGSRTSLQAIKDGDIQQMSIWSPYQMGRDALKAAVMILSSPGYVAGTMQAVVWEEITSVTIANVDIVDWPPV